MIEIRAKQRMMLSMLEEYTGCTIVPANTTKKMPSYPFISYSIINISTRKGTYAEYTGFKDVEGVKVPTKIFAMPASAVYSFTVQHEDEAEALIIAMEIKDFFEKAKRQELADIDVIVSDVGGITSRDNLLSIEYEYRKGLDVRLSLVNVIEDKSTEVIETATLTSEDVGEINIEKE